MNKVIIVEASESDRRLMLGLLVKHGYEPIAIENMEAAKNEVAKLPPGAVVVAAMKFTGGTAQELINWQKREGYKFPVIAVVDNFNANVIVFGESGTGKEQIARQIYLNSSRTESPCIVLDAESAALVGNHNPKSEQKPCRRDTREI